jgi:hypothetical protein
MCSRMLHDVVPHLQQVINNPLRSPFNPLCSPFYNDALKAGEALKGATGKAKQAYKFATFDKTIPG